MWFEEVKRIWPNDLKKRGFGPLCSQQLTMWFEEVKRIWPNDLKKRGFGPLCSQQSSFSNTKGSHVGCLGAKQSQHQGPGDL
jgi:hypothetical protein